MTRACDPGHQEPLMPQYPVMVGKTYVLMLNENEQRAVDTRRALLGAVPEDAHRFEGSDVHRVAPVPFIVTAVQVQVAGRDRVNGRVLLDGTDELWLQAVELDRLIDVYPERLPEALDAQAAQLWPYLVGYVKDLLRAVVNIRID